MNLQQLNEQTFREFSVCCARVLGVVVEHDDVTLAFCNVAPLNRVLCARFEPENADRRIAEVLESISPKPSPVMWITCPLDRPEDIGDRLVAAGFGLRGEWTAMAMALENLADEVPLPEGVTIHEVTDQQQAAVWCKTVCRGFEIGEPLHKTVSDIFLPATFAQGSPLRHFVAFADGVPAAGCTLLNGSGAVGVFFVGTVPEARRRGLGTAVTHHALLNSRDWGHSHAVLQATPAGRPVYERMGFVECRVMKIYGRVVE